MSNLPTQQNSSAYVQQFSEQNARELVEDMLFLYGKKFTDQWSGLKKSQIIPIFLLPDKTL